jgi:hypothetical protein
MMGRPQNRCGSSVMKIKFNRNNYLNSIYSFRKKKRREKGAKFPKGIITPG